MNSRPKFYRGEKFRKSTLDITEIPIGMNGFLANSPQYTYVRGSKATAQMTQKTRAEFAGFLFGI